MRNHKSAMRIKKKEIKERKFWTFNPATRVEPCGKKYNRSKAKRSWRKDVNV